MTIRHAEPNDLPRIAALEAASYPSAEGASEQSLRERIAAFPQCFWLAERGGELLGFVNGMLTNERDLTDAMYETASLHDPNGRTLMIFSVVTAAEHRQNGVASELMRRVLSDMDTDGREAVVLTCKERLLPFYARFGFANEGVSRSEHGGATWYQMRYICPIRQEKSHAVSKCV